MKATKPLQISALSFITLYTPLNGRGQALEYAVDARLTSGICNVQIQNGTNLNPIYYNFTFIPTNLSETLYLDPAAHTVRQAGSVPMPSPATVSFLDVQVIRTSPPPTIYATGYVTVTLSIGDTFTFDTGEMPYAWNGSANAYTFDSSFQNSFLVSGSYSAVTDGYWLKGAFSFPMYAIPWYWLYAFDAMSTMGDTNFITLSVTNTRPASGYYYGPPWPGVIADATAPNGFHVQLQVRRGGGGWYLDAPAVGTLIASNPPTIILQPQSQTVSAHTTAAFGVSVVGTPPFSYQWRLNGGNLVGARTSSLTISNTVPMNLGSYDVVVVNPYGSVTSSNALLSMYPYLAVPFTGAVTCWGKPATLSVRAWGTGPLSYQWYKDSSAVLDGTNAALVFASIQFTNAGMYSLVVSSPLGSVTNDPAQVVVNPAGVSLDLYGQYPGVTIDGVVGYTYVIQRSPDLSNTNAWITLTNLTLTQPLELWVDASLNATLPTNSYRFYRVLPGQ